MKRLLGTAAILMAFAAPAQANDYPTLFNPYVGIDYQAMNVKFDGGSETANGVNVHVGNRFNEHVGVELGYFHTEEVSQTIEPTLPITAKARLVGVTLDALGYLPVNEDKTLELIGSVGVSHIVAKAKFSVAGIPINDNANEWGFRAGAGAQYHITDKVSLRGMARYQSADFDDIAKRAWVYTAGLNYSF